VSIADSQNRDGAEDDWQTTRRRELAEVADQKRLALIDRLRAEDEDDLADELERCNQPLRIVCTNCGDLADCRTHCMRRFCPLCARRISAKRVGRYVKAAASMQWPLHITLTVRNTKDVNLETFRRLQAAFKKLRKQKLWANNVKGGVASIELTNRGKGWHPHIHVLADVEWLAIKAQRIRPFDSRARAYEKCKAAARELGEAWAALVQQKTASVKSRRCNGMIAVIEVLKYAVKPEALIECEDNPGDAIRAMQRARLFTAFGSLYGKMKSLDAEKPKCACGKCGEIGMAMPEHVFEMFCKSQRSNWRAGL